MEDDRFKRLEINQTPPSPAPADGSKSGRAIACPKCGVLNEPERETCWECFSLLNARPVPQASKAQEKAPAAGSAAAGLEISVPALGLWNKIVFALMPGPFLLFFLYALNGWTFSPSFVPLGGLARGQFAYPAIWAAGVAFVAGVFLWALFGREVFAIRGSTLILRTEVFGIGLSRRFDAAKVGGLRVGGPRSKAGLCFDYGGRRISVFGVGIVLRQAVTFFGLVGEAERERLFDQITDRYPNLTSARSVE